MPLSGRKNWGKKRGEGAERKPREKRPPKPLDAEKLQELALHYVSRYATTRAKLVRYLERKLRERGWDEEASGGEPSFPQEIAETFAARGFLDDEAYAQMRGRDLLRRGYGPRRVGQALREAGVEEGIRERVDTGPRKRAKAAILLARKKRIGPFSIEPPDMKTREKHLAAMLRAGHAFTEAKRVLDAGTEQELDEWLDELAEWDG